MIDVSKCGAKDPRSAERGCLYPAGHVGEHYAGRFHWKGEPSKVAKSATKAAPDAERDLARAHHAKHAEKRAEVAAKKKTKPAAARFCDDRENATSGASSVCALPPEHEGEHSDGVKTWPRGGHAEPAELARCASQNTAIWHEPAQCEFTADHEGDHEATVTVPAGWPETGQVRRIGWDEKGSGTRNDTLSTQNRGPLTLDDEPEGAEADAAGLAAIEAQELADLEDVPARDEREPCGAPRTGVPGGCQLFENHAGEHFACVHGHAHAWRSGGDVNAWEVCGARWSMTPSEKGPKKLPKGAAQTVCQRPGEHDGDHRGLDDIGNHMSEWDGDGARGGCHRPKTKIDFVAELLGHPERDEAAARAREAIAIAQEPKESLADACAKCGREFGEHDGKKCPKVTKAPKAKAAPLAQPVAVTPSGPRILGYRRHPAAALYPMIESTELAALAADIKENGLRDALVLIVDENDEEWLLDGSNRGAACAIACIAPRFEHYQGPRDMATLVRYVISKNDKRRHLTPSIRAMIAADAAGLGRGNPGNRETGSSAGLLSQAEAAELAGAKERLTRRAAAVKKDGVPKLREAVLNGKLSVEAAEVASKASKALQNEIADEALAKKRGEVKSGRVRALVNQEGKRAVVRKINEQRVAPAPLGPFGVIVIDPPWPYENSDQHDGSRGHIDYPPMPIDDICALRGELDARAKEDCILGMWVTNAFVHEIGDVLAAWGFTPRTMYTWDKEIEGVGTWGRGRTEHLVIASRGAPTHTLNEIATLLAARRREHSRKPDEMYALLAKHCSGPMLDMFAREPREGWATWGAEPQKFAGAA